MNLATKLAWEYRWSWLAMFLLTAASGLVLIVSSHTAWANGIVSAETGNASLKFDFYLSVVATLLVVQTIAALCLESQARDLAIIKTCGASPRSIRRTLVGEILAVAVAGFVLGLIVALPIIQPYTTWAVGLASDVQNRVFGYDAGSFIGAAIALVAVVLIGSYATLQRVSQQNVVSALQGETQSRKKRRRILSGIFATLAIVGNVIIIGMAFSAQAIIAFLTHMITQGMGDDTKSAQSFIAGAEGGIIILMPMLFVLGMMIISGAFAPRLYRWILTGLARILPSACPGWLEVGIKQAAHNASKYYGSITPLVIFILTVVMVFCAIDSSLAPITTLYMQHGVDVSTLENGTDYQSVAMLVGPALFISFAGALANMMMSGRGRIYVNKLTSIIGVKNRQLFWQALAETTSYVYVAAIIGVVTMFASSGLVWVSGNAISGVQHPYVISWPAFVLALLFILIVISVPAVVSVFRSRKLSSKQVLESFGE